MIYNKFLTTLKNNFVSTIILKNDIRLQGRIILFLDDGIVLEDEKKDQQVISVNSICSISISTTHSEKEINSFIEMLNIAELVNSTKEENFNPQNFIIHQQYFNYIIKESLSEKQKKEEEEFGNKLLAVSFSSSGFSFSGIPVCCDDKVQLVLANMKNNPPQIIFWSSISNICCSKIEPINNDL